MSAQKSSIVFLGVNVDLFKNCFFPGEEKEWNSYELIIIDDSSFSASADLTKYLQEPRVQSVVIERLDMDALLLSTVRKFYDSGGSVVFFGIYGVFADPSSLSRLFDLPEPWHFSAYTRENYEITYTGMTYLGYEKMEQQYTKCNLLKVPVQDRWMVAKALPLHQYIDEHAGSLDGEEPSEEWKEEAEEAKAGYIKYCESQYHQCPLAVHKNKNGGRIAYLGFVNGDGNIPFYVRRLVTKSMEH